MAAISKRQRARYINKKQKHIAKRFYIQKKSETLQYVFAFIYITCTLSIADGSHFSLHLYTEIKFFGVTFLYTKKAKKSVLFTNGIYKKNLILSALLSNKNEILHL